MPEIFREHYSWKEIQISQHVALIKKNTVDGRWLKILEEAHQAKIFGGWLENRTPLFDTRHVPESHIHLGVDFWLPEGTEVLCPAPGKVLLNRQKNSECGGWGTRIDILIQDHVWIFGHLKEPLPPTKKTLEASEPIAILGNREENGGWLPHLHLQTMRKADYLQLSEPEILDAYAETNPNLKFLFPNPLVLLKTL